MVIKYVAVLGAGRKGSGIAAHFANAGVTVLLLDIPAREGPRNAIAISAIQQLEKANPQQLMRPEAIKLISPGNFDDDLPRLAECDWIIEATIEDPFVKRALYRRVDAARKLGSIVSSDTIAIPLQELVRGQSAPFKADFCITHFGNPPRYMRLMELVVGSDTRPEIAAELTRFCDLRLGKEVVRCKDTPGFIANRIGTYWITCAVKEAIARGLTVEEADAVHRRTLDCSIGVFGLLDVIGLEFLPMMSQLLLAALPEGDDFRRVYTEQPLLLSMIGKGSTGRNGRGFYRVTKAGLGRAVRVIDLRTGTYRRISRSNAVESDPRDLRALVSHDNPAGRYATAVLAQTLAYVASLVPAIAADVPAVDRAMRLAFGWGRGPFELMDRLGTDWLAGAITQTGLPVPPLLALAKGRNFYRVRNGCLEYLTTGDGHKLIVRPDAMLLLADIKRTGKPVLNNSHAGLWDVGDGVLCFEFTSKMNSLDHLTLDLLSESLDLAARSYKGIVIYNEGDNFSVGANLGSLVSAVNIADWAGIERRVKQGQVVCRALKYSPIPVVGAPSGLALGAACELMLHCAAVQAHSEAYLGLNEVGVGLPPGWGGCKELLARWQADPLLPRGPMPAVAKAFEIISTAQVSRSATQARELKFLRPTDGITMNRDRLLFDAKRRVLELAGGYEPPLPPEYRLPGPGGRAALDLVVDSFAAQGKAMPHDVVVSKTVAYVLTGGEADPLDTLTEGDLAILERDAFLQLARQPASQARAKHVLATGVPLRN